MTSRIDLSLQNAPLRGIVLLGPLLLGALRLVGCSSSSNPGAGGGRPPDGGSGDVPTADASLGADGDDGVVPGDDASKPTADSGPSTIPVTDAGTIGSPATFTVSSAGPTRFFNVKYDAAGAIYAVGVTASGVDAAGDFSTLVAKFSGDGALDTTFGSGGYALKNLAVGANGELARAIAIQSTGKVVVAAAVEHADATDARDRDIAVVRFDAHGAVDPTFGTAGVALFDLSAGAMKGSSFLADAVWSINPDATDRLVLTGAMVDPGGTYTDFVVMRLGADGAIDDGFATHGVFSKNVDGLNAGARNGTILADGSIIAAGYVEDANGSVPVVYKLTSSGALDSTFGDAGVFHEHVLGASTETYAAVAQGTTLVTTGYGRNTPDASLDFVSLRLSSLGVLDPSYGTNGVAQMDIGGFNDNSRNLLVLPDGRIVLVGGGRPTAANVDGVVAVLTADGKPDTTFATGGYKLYDLGGPADFFWGVALSPAHDRLAIAGIDGVGSNPGNDQGALLVLPVPH